MGYGEEFKEVPIDVREVLGNMFAEAMVSGGPLAGQGEDVAADEVIARLERAAATLDDPAAEVTPQTFDAEAALVLELQRQAEQRDQS